MAIKRAILLTTALLLLATTTWSDEQVHTLVRGETVYTLARRYDVPVDVLLEYNGIADPTRLAVGTRIRIPGSYVVEEGEYVYAIAQRFGVDWLELLDANGLGRDDVVRPGDVLLVPRGAVDTAIAENPGAAGSSELPERGSSETPPVVQSAVTTGVPARSSWPHPGERAPWQGKFPGIVMSGSVGDEFRSVSRGVVEYVGPFSSFGKLILVRSENGYLYGYAGADRVLVIAGERVVSGTTLGTVGFSPAFDSAMVLFTVWRNNRYVDPETVPRG